MILSRSRDGKVGRYREFLKRPDYSGRFFIVYIYLLIYIVYMDYIFISSKSEGLKKSFVLSHILLILNKVF